MKKKIMVLLVGGTVMAVMASMSPGGDVPLSSGAPIGATSAPGEQTCGKSGCHTGENNINTGKGVLSISSMQDITNYQPGQTYDIAVTLEESGVERFGFSLTVLDEYNNKAGTLVVTEQLRTQIFNGGREFINREYMTYRMVGTNPYQQGKGVWTFKWKAPDYYAGKITFYAGGVSANNDATDKGDLVYTVSMVSGEEYTSVHTLNGEDNAVSVYPNPVKNYMQVRPGNRAEGSFSFRLYNTAGVPVTGLHQADILPGGSVTIPVAGLPAGVYYLAVQGSSLSVTKKVLLIN